MVAGGQNQHPIAGQERVGGYSEDTSVGVARLQIRLKLWLPTALEATVSALHFSAKRNENTSKQLLVVNISVIMTLTINDC